MTTENYSLLNLFSYAIKVSIRKFHMQTNKAHFQFQKIANVFVT